MQAFNANVQDRILFFVRAILEQNAIAAEVKPESRLVDIGLTSMDMVNLMLSVEAEFDFTIPQDQITPENFQSVKTLETMIVGQLSPKRRPEGSIAVPAKAGMTRDAVRANCFSRHCERNQLARVASPGGPPSPVYRRASST
jgi:acyl carrier protein